MSHSQFHCTGRVYLDLHGLIFETSICYWQDQPGSPQRTGVRRRRKSAGIGREGGSRAGGAAAPPRPDTPKTPTQPPTQPAGRPAGQHARAWLRGTPVGTGGRSVAIRVNGPDGLVPALSVAGEMTVSSGEATAA